MSGENFVSWILKMSDLLIESMVGGDGGRVCLCVPKSSNTLIPTHASNTHTHIQKLKLKLKKDKVY